MATQTSSCSVLKEGASLEDVADAIRSEIMVAMLDAFNGTAALCAEICLRRLQAVHKDLQLLSDKELGTDALGQRKAAASDGASYFLMNKDDEESEKQSSEVPPSPDVHAWYTAKDDAVVLRPPSDVPAGPPPSNEAAPTSTPQDATCQDDLLVDRQPLPPPREATPPGEPASSGQAVPLTAPPVEALPPSEKAPDSEGGTQQEQPDEEDDSDLSACFGPVATPVQEQAKDVDDAPASAAIAQPTLAVDQEQTERSIPSDYTPDAPDGNAVSEDDGDLAEELAACWSTSEPLASEPGALPMPGSPSPSPGLLLAKQSSKPAAEAPDPADEKSLPAPSGASVSNGKTASGAPEPKEKEERKDPAQEGNMAAGEGAATQVTAPAESNEPVMDIIVPDGCTYQGEKLPDACTVAKWKSLLEDGSFDGSKVLYARKLVCHAGRDKRKLLDNDAVLPLRPEVVAVTGPGAVMQMLELSLRKRLGKPLPPPIEAAEGRAFACACGSCRFMVHSDPACGNYCCNMCLESDGRAHGEDCEQRIAPKHAPKGKPQAKYRAMCLSTDDLLKKEATFKPLAGEAKKKVYEMVKARGNFIGPYCDLESMTALDCKKRLLMHNAEHAWTLDYNLNFYCELLYEGIFPMGYEIPCYDGPIQTLLFCYDRKVSVWDFHETHISRRVRKHAKLYSMTVDNAFDDVIIGIVRQHGEAWLYRGLRWLLRKLFKEGYKGTKSMHFGIHTFELWDEERNLVAGDLGCTIGGVYMSFSGFRMKDTKSCGEVQMVLTAGLLSRMGFDWMDLGQVLKYKERMGAKVITRKEYHSRLSRDRDKTTVFSHERISGEELLTDILQAVADGPKAMPTGEAEEFVVVNSKVAVRDKPSLEAKIVAVLHKDAEVEGTPHDVGGLPWLCLENGWVLMDGKTLGMGKLLQPKIGQVDYGAEELPSAELQDQEAAAQEDAPLEEPPQGEKQQGEETQAAGEGEEGEEEKAEDKKAVAETKEGAEEERKRKAAEREARREEEKKKRAERDAAADEEKRKKKAEKEAAAKKKAAERVVRLHAKQEEAARQQQAAEEAEKRALARRENPEAFKPKSLKEKKKWKREEEALRRKEEAEAAKQRAKEEEIAKQQALEELKKKRAEEAEAAKKKAEEQAILRKAAEEEALKKKGEDEAMIRAMVLTVTEGAKPGPNHPKTLSKQKLNALVSKCQVTMEDQETEDDGRLWVVTGGEGKGGILVRAGESMGSRQLPTRLLTGTTVEELDIAGNRLHYKRIRGDGPDWGWVSIMLQGKLLVEPLPR